MLFQEEQLDRYFKFIEDRHAIYLARQRGDSYPWTDDPILRDFRFTNIFRELDTGTIWLRKNIIEPHYNSPMLFFHVCAYRMINLWQTYQDVINELGFFEEFDAKAFSAVLRKRKAEHKAVFTNAHMLTGTLGGGDKIYQIVELSMGYLWKNYNTLSPNPGDSLEIMFHRLDTIPGVGPFVAYEITTDLRHTRYLYEAFDIMYWANAGPGATRGLERLAGVFVGRKDRKSGVKPARHCSQDEYCSMMRTLLGMAPNRTAPWVPNMEMRDIEHSLCEWDKYERTRLGQGKPRRKYRYEQV